MTLPLLFWLVEQFPDTGCHQQTAKQLFQQRGIHGYPQEGEEQCSYTSGKDPGHDLSKGDHSLPPPEEACHQCTGNEKQQIDSSGLCWRKPLHQGQPENQQTAAADAEAGQEPKQNARKDGNYHR